MIGKTILEASKLYNQIPNSHFSDVLTGTVTQVSPLTIKVNDKLVLTEKMLILSAFVQETWINIPTTPSSLEPADEKYQHRHEIIGQTEPEKDSNGVPHTHEINLFTQFAHPKILLWRGLQVGDMVYLLRVAKGQTFFVLQRIEGITNEK